MNMPKRKSRPFARKSKLRDAKAIVIATEGELTEPIYFEALALDERFRNPRVKITVLPTTEGHSAPDHVIRRLDKIRRNYRFYEGDQLWLVIDKDNWDDSKLSRIAQLVSQEEKYYLADSTARFELWLLLHHRSLDHYTELELTELKENRKEKFRSKRRRLDLELADICGSYDRSRLKSSDYIPHIEVAIPNAENADENKDDRWLNEIGSRVYKLAQSIISSSTSPNNPSH